MFPFQLEVSDKAALRRGPVPLEEPGECRGGLFRSGRGGELARQRPGQGRAMVMRMVGKAELVSTLPRIGADSCGAGRPGRRSSGAGAGVGKTVLLTEMIHNMIGHQEGVSIFRRPSCSLARGRVKDSTRPLTCCNPVPKWPRRASSASGTISWRRKSDARWRNTKISRTSSPCSAWSNCRRKTARWSPGPEAAA